MKEKRRAAHIKARQPHRGLAQASCAYTLAEVLACCRGCFPKTQTAADLTTNAPTSVSEEQLKELHIRMKLPVKVEG